MSDYVCRYCRQHFEFQLIAPFYDGFKFCSIECEKAFKEEEEKKNHLNEELRAELRENRRIESSYQYRDSGSNLNKPENENSYQSNYTYVPQRTDAENKSIIYGKILSENVPLLILSIGINLFLISKMDKSIWTFFVEQIYVFIVSGILFALIPIGEPCTPIIGTILLLFSPIPFIAPSHSEVLKIYSNFAIIFLMCQVGWTLHHYISLSSIYKSSKKKEQRIDNLIRSIEINNILRWILHLTTIPVFIMTTIWFNGVIALGFILAILYWFIQYYIASNFLS
jgi:hypothetical protein